jgi:hypothetical protein
LPKAIRMCADKRSRGFIVSESMVALMRSRRWNA